MLLVNYLDLMCLWRSIIGDFATLKRKMLVRSNQRSCSIIEHDLILAILNYQICEWTHIIDLPPIRHESFAFEAERMRILKVFVANQFVKCQRFVQAIV